MFVCYQCVAAPYDDNVPSIERQKDLQICHRSLLYPPSQCQELYCIHSFLPPSTHMVMDVDVLEMMLVSFGNCVNCLTIEWLSASWLAIEWVSERELAGEWVSEWAWASWRLSEWVSEWVSVSWMPIEWVSECELAGDWVSECELAGDWVSEW